WAATILGPKLRLVAKASSASAKRRFILTPFCGMPNCNPRADQFSKVTFQSQQLSFSNQPNLNGPWPNCSNIQALRCDRRGNLLDRHCKPGCSAVSRFALCCLCTSEARARRAAK